MVDFGKRLTGKKTEKIVDPIELYETLDRAHDKGPLRPIQEAVLKNWISSHRNKKDVILKLHTGQGKTLCGLLMLQSQLNKNGNPVLYLCPNKFLIKQTRDQAKQFGISTCTAETDLPDDFLNGKTILVTSIQKLFNGLTKFGLSQQSISIDTLLMDDAHACSDSIRQACRIRIPNNSDAYNELMTLFSQSLEQQGVGTYADIKNKEHNALLPVPYWDWMEKESEVTRILSRSSTRKNIKFVWPLIKNTLRNCRCVVSGSAIEIEPNIPPLEMFGTYWKAKHRIFMSATVTDDAFLIKGLQLSSDTAMNPLTHKEERWSGEKMILIPALIHKDLDRSTIVQCFGQSDQNRKYGVVAITPSFSQTADWKKYGARVADAKDIQLIVEDLKGGEFSSSIVLVNRYDGIDLPDDSCRILIIDGKPHSESLIDLYQEGCRSSSLFTKIRTLRSIEQGFGRSVRGEKDYSVVMLIGADVTRLMRDRNISTYLSGQMNAQIKIGLDIADMAKQEIKLESNDPLVALKKLIYQCINRDPEWKNFYTDEMNSVEPSGLNKEVLELYEKELAAEQSYLSGEYESSVDILQSILDTNKIGDSDRGWYLQEMARYLHQVKRLESQKLQINAHKKNRFLLRPPSGTTTTKLTIVSEGRIERIIKWVGQFDSYRELSITLSDVLGKLVFGVRADHFEQALNELSQVLGFKGQRPDKEWKEGPDNLWVLDRTRYILWECKNEVKIGRESINKRETEQMNRSCAWFEKYYPDCSVANIIIHPSNKVNTAASFIRNVEVMNVGGLKIFIGKVLKFYKSFETMDFNDLSSIKIQKLIDEYELSLPTLLSKCSKTPHDLR
jgi:replicative superfamily II helicase